MEEIGLAFDAMVLLTEADPHVVIPDMAMPVMMIHTVQEWKSNVVVESPR